MSNEIATTAEHVPATLTEQPETLLHAIVQMASNPAVDVTKLQAILEMQERLEGRQAERAYNVALAQTQAEIPHISKLGTVALGSGTGSSKFARWEDMDKVLRPLMDKHGFTLSFDTGERGKDGGGAIVTGILRHREGHSERASISLPLDSGPGRNSLQALGSTLSYGKRYVAEMLFNMVRKGEDNDAADFGKKYVTQEQADELVALLKEAGRQEGSFIPAMASDARSCEEVDARDFDRVRSALLEIVKKKAPRA
jgi:hypothetical protein